MFFIEAALHNEDGDGDDDIVIGLFSTPEKVVDAARNWVRQEREDGLQDDICLWGWRMTPDTTVADRLDLTNDQECISLICKFREIEKEFPAVEEE